MEQVGSLQTWIIIIITVIIWVNFYDMGAMKEKKRQFWPYNTNRHLKTDKREPMSCAYSSAIVSRVVGMKMNMYMCRIYYKLILPNGKMEPKQRRHTSWAAAAATAATTNKPNKTSFLKFIEHNNSSGFSPSFFLPHLVGTSSQPLLLPHIAFYTYNETIEYVIIVAIIVITIVIIIMFLSALRLS